MPTVADLTGLNLLDMAEAENYYRAHSSHIVDTPEFSDAVLPYLIHLKTARNGEKWADFVAGREYVKDHVNRADDFTRAIFPVEIGASANKFYATPPEFDRLDKLLGETAGQWSADATDPLLFDVMSALIELAPVWARVPVYVDPSTADFVWSRARCVISGAGFNFFRPLAEQFCKKYATCPFSPDESRQQWLDNLLVAHKNCGWPVQIILLPWKETAACISPLEEDGTYDYIDWHGIVALLHVLKHCRVDDTKEWLLTTYRGHSGMTQLAKEKNTLGLMKTVVPDLVTLLGVPLSTKKDPRPMGLSFKWALNHLSTKHLLVRKPTERLPGMVLCGAWSSLATDPEANEGFIQHGSQLTGVWQAANGHVHATTGESADIMNYDWNGRNPNNVVNDEARRRLEMIIPSTYEVGYPSDLFFAAFPNLTTENMYDDIAVRCIFDSPIIASLIRTEIPGLDKEFPLVGFFPKTPTLAEATNQGKTSATLTYARMLNPGIDAVMIATDSTSAPDNRAVSNQIRIDGMVALDEFRIPRAMSHPLSRDHLQSLCTGGKLNAGEVLKNDPAPLKLRHSLVVAAKAADFGPDLRNRTFPFFLDLLTDEQRSHGDTWKAIQTGSLAIQARLGALALIEQTDFITTLKGYEQTATNKGVRFGIHRAIARLLYYLRTGKEDKGQVDKAFQHMVAVAEEHTDAADDSGVLSSMEGHNRVKIRLSNFFYELGADEINIMAAHLRANLSPHMKGACIRELFKARLIVASMSGMAFSKILEPMCGIVSRASDKQLCDAFSHEIKQTIQRGEGYRLPGHLGIAGWHLFRVDSGTTMSVLLEQVETKLNDTTLV